MTLIKEFKSNPWTWLTVHITDKGDYWLTIRGHRNMVKRLSKQDIEKRYSITL